MQSPVKPVTAKPVVPRSPFFDIACSTGAARSRRGLGYRYSECHDTGAPVAPSSAAISRSCQITPIPERVFRASRPGLRRGCRAVGPSGRRRAQLPISRPRPEAHVSWRAAPRRGCAPRRGAGLVESIRAVRLHVREELLAHARRPVLADVVGNGCNGILSPLLGAKEIADVVGHLHQVMHAVGVRRAARDVIRGARATWRQRHRRRRSSGASPGCR